MYFGGPFAHHQEFGNFATGFALGYQCCHLAFTCR